MALDLSALEEKPTAPAVAGAAQPTGKPLDIPLADIEEDPDQPRKEFTPEAMQEMTDSVRARGVKTPVSVRTHPSKPGKWMLNFGARRYRGSLAAGRATIPAFVDEAHDDYDQVIENIQRDDLKPMELALFIKKRLDAGDQKKAIAKNLGKDGAIITQHLALIDPPACIEDAYSNGKCTSPKTLYELRGLHEKFPEQRAASRLRLKKRLRSRSAPRLTLAVTDEATQFSQRQRSFYVSHLRNLESLRHAGDRGGFGLLPKDRGFARRGVAGPAAGAHVRGRLVLAPLGFAVAVCGHRLAAGVVPWNPVLGVLHPRIAAGEPLKRKKPADGRICRLLPSNHLKGRA